MTPVLNEIAVQLRALHDTRPCLAMDRLEELIDALSIRELSRVLNVAYAEESAELGVDWKFTATQWKLGNRGAGEFLEACPEARLTVWSHPFGERDGEAVETRFTTCLPFRFKKSWKARRMRRARV